MVLLAERTKLSPVPTTKASGSSYDLELKFTSLRLCQPIQRHLNCAGSDDEAEARSKEEIKELIKMKLGRFRRNFSWEQVD